jgi:hypothetical protein
LASAFNLNFFLGSSDEFFCCKELAGILKYHSKTRIDGSHEKFENCPTLAMTLPSMASSNFKLPKYFSS